MNIVPLKKEHLERIHAQGAQDYVSEWITPEIKEQLAGDIPGSMAFAAIEDNQVLGCAGVIEYWPGRAAAWAILSGGCGRRFLRIHRAVKAFLDLKRYRRLEATADIGHSAGHVWLELLGFTLETPRMPGYLPNGGDAAMYVRGI